MCLKNLLWNLQKVKNKDYIFILAKFASDSNQFEIGDKQIVKRIYNKDSSPMIGLSA